VCIPRHEMPQVDLEQIETLYEYCQHAGIPHFRGMFPISGLSKRQCADHFDPSRFHASNQDRPLIIARAGQVLDGNHRLTDALRRGLVEVDCILLWDTFEDARKRLLEMPGVYKVNTEGRRVP